MNDASGEMAVEREKRRLWKAQPTFVNDAYGPRNKNAMRRTPGF